MKKMILLSFLVLFIPAIVYGQDKVVAPAWNIGDKWVLGESVTIVVANADESSYAVKYLTAGGESILIFENSTLWTKINEYRMRGETKDFSIFH
jgi:hypothetical protein